MPNSIGRILANRAFFFFLCVHSYFSFISLNSNMIIENEPSICLSHILHHHCLSHNFIFRNRKILCNHFIIPKIFHETAKVRVRKPKSKSAFNQTGPFIFAVSLHVTLWMRALCCGSCFNFFFSYFRYSQCIRSDERRTKVRMHDSIVVVVIVAAHAAVISRFDFLLT